VGAAGRPAAGHTVTVTDLELRFEAGSVTGITASSGDSAMRAIVGADAGAVRLGEVAIVDGSSRVGQLGLVLHNGLFDENAACHVALGQGYAVGVASERGRRRSWRSSGSTCQACTSTS
jgi:aminopeptidase